MANAPDPFDVEALGTAVNDSANRVSAIWVTFLVFLLYLLIAATTVTQRQLLLAEPIKMPVLNVDLPLWGFFFLTPILFVVLHAYVLLQVILLGHTAAAYNAAVTQWHLSPRQETSLRQRLANTLFAQIFAGSPRERQGWLGWLLTGITWITLAIGPILLLLVFQFRFLPYHSHIVTWTHRLLIVLELGAFFLIWPLVLDPEKDLNWPSLPRNLSREGALRRLFSLTTLRWFRLRAAGLAACLFFVVGCLWIGTFPGEPHVNLFSLSALSSVHCDRFIQRKFGRVDLRFERLNLPEITVVDSEKYSKFVSKNSELGLKPSEGERTQVLSDRDFVCGDFSSGDFRRVDFTGARLSGAALGSASLQGALLKSADMRMAHLEYAHLQGADLTGARLQNAILENSRLEDAILTSVNAEAANFGYAHLEGVILQRANFRNSELSSAKMANTEIMSADFTAASLRSTDLRGSFMVDDDFRAANFNGAVLYAAIFKRSKGSGAVFTDAGLQGVIFQESDLGAASFEESRLQGATFFESNVTLAYFSNSYLWYTDLGACEKAQIINPNLNPIIGRDTKVMGKYLDATQEDLKIFVDRAFNGVADESKSRLQSNFIERLDVGNKSVETTRRSVIESCANKASATEEYDKRLARYLVELGCEDTVVLRGILRNRVSLSARPNTTFIFNPNPSGASLFAREFLDQENRACLAKNGLDEKTTQALRKASELGKESH
jgi:uncharacterized protein YjbI with pentapeptide repeats